MVSPKRFRAAKWTFLICAFLAVSSAFRAWVQSPQPRPAESRMPVLVELFASEGCSDCPPADRILEELDAKQPVPGAQAIVLSEHVTYWNHQGWRDPYSLDEIDLRQKEYGDRFTLDSVYTPQAVIDGAAQVVGNNAPGVAKAVEYAASSPKKTLTIGDAHWDRDAVAFTLHGAPYPGSRWIAVLAADATGHQVIRGENAGRTLHHVAVVRTIKEFGAHAADGRPLRLPAGNLTGDLAAAPVRLVAFQTDTKTGHVVAVAEQTLSR